MPNTNNITPNPDNNVAFMFNGHLSTVYRELNGLMAELVEIIEGNAYTREEKAQLIDVLRIVRNVHVDQHNRLSQIPEEPPMKQRKL